MNSLLILGPGYTAKVVADRAVNDAWKVLTAGRTSVGYDHTDWDALGEPTFDHMVTDRTVVLYSVPTLFKRLEPNSPHRTPMQKVIEVCERKKALALIYLSSTAVYGDQNGEWVDEETPRTPTSDVGEMRRDIEDLVLDTAFGYVIRIVGIYGPGRTLVEAFDRGQYRLVDGGEKVSNRIHVEDLAATILAVANQLPGLRTFIAADGSPRKVADVVAWLENNLGVQPPESMTLQEYSEFRGPNHAARWINSIRCSNSRMRDVLGVTPVYGDVLTGYRSIFENDLEQNPND